MDKIFLIDCSGYLYRSYFAIRNMTNAKGESTNAIFGFIRSILKLFKDFKPNYIAAIFDGPNNSIEREKIYPEYKAHRSSIPLDLIYQIQWAHHFCDLLGIPQLNISNVEADDTMGSIALWAEKNGAIVYLCTSDKDMAQLVTDRILLLNTHKENLISGPKEVEQIYGVSPEKMIDFLAIIGDSSDNIPGFSGFGPKTACALLNEFGTLENIFNHVDKLPVKKREIVEREKQQVLLSQKLVTVNTAVDFPKDPDFFKIKTPDIVKLKEFYQNMSFHSLIRELESGELFKEAVSSQESKQEELFYTLVDTEQELDDLIALLQKQKEVCFATVATSVQPLQAELVGVSFSIEERRSWYVPANGKLGLSHVVTKLRNLFVSTGIAFYSHNIKYHCHVLNNYGIDVVNISFDTMLASYLLNAHQRQHSLDYLSMQYFGLTKVSIQTVLGKGKQAKDIQNVEREKICTFCCEEVDFTFRLKSILQKDLKERNLETLFYDVEMPLLMVLKKMERNGIYLDIDCLEKMSLEVSKEIRSLEEEIYQMAGEPFNLNSPKQLSDILFNKLGIKPPKKTATGLSTNAEVLESLKFKYPIAEKLIEYRLAEKLRSTYIDSLPGQVNPKTGRIHCTFNQSVAATGRLSSQDPNLQNIPIRSEAGRKIRAAFMPQKKGWSFLSADYSQIELRILAHLSGDPHLISAFAHNEDIHRSTAASILTIPLNQVTEEQRHQAKAVNFGIVYGQQGFGLSQVLGISTKEASFFIEKYFQQYPRVKEFTDTCKENARKTGKTVTMIGRERLVPEITSKNFMLRSAAERLAVNAPLQGTAADLIKLAMLRIDELLESEKMHSLMILQIHDELLFEVPDEEIDRLKVLVKKEMEGVWDLKVPLVVDISIGKNWEEC